MKKINIFTLCCGERVRDGKILPHGKTSDEEQIKASMQIVSYDLGPLPSQYNNFQGQVSPNNQDVTVHRVNR